MLMRYTGSIPLIGGPMEVIKELSCNCIENMTIKCGCARDTAWIGCGCKGSHSSSDNSEKVIYLFQGLRYYKF